MSTFIEEFGNLTVGEALGLNEEMFNKEGGK